MLPGCIDPSGQPEKVLSAIVTLGMYVVPALYAWSYVIIHTARISTCVTMHVLLRTHINTARSSTKQLDAVRVQNRSFDVKKTAYC